MKRLLTAVIFTLFFFMAAFPVRLHAGGLTFSVGSVGAATGDNVVVPINVSGNPGFVSASLVVYYDPNALEILRIEAPVAEMPLSPQFAHTTTPGVQWLSFINTGLVDWSGNGTLANIYFSIKPNAVLGANNVLLTFTDIPDGTPGNAVGGIINDAATVSGHVYALQASQSPTPAPSQPAAPTAPAESQTPTPTPVQIPQQPPTAPEPTKSPAPSAPVNTPVPVQSPTPTPTPTPTPAQSPASPSATPSLAPSPSPSPAPGNADNGGSETPENGAADAQNDKGTSGTAVFIAIIGVLAVALISCVAYIFLKKREIKN